MAQRKFRQASAIPTGEQEEAQPTRLPASARREQLLEVALELFSQRGFSGTTTREIAIAAGVTEAIIFRHFETKEQLYKAIIDRSITGPDTEEWLAELRLAMKRDDDELVFRRIINAIVVMHKTDPKFERVMLHAALEGNQVALLHMRQITAEIVDEFIRYLKRRQDEGALRAMSPEATLVAIVGMAKHFAQIRYIHGFEKDCLTDDQAVESFVSIALHGINSPPGETEKSSPGKKR